MTIWLLIEEARSGSLPGGSPYCVLSAHETELGADAARERWRKAECSDGVEPGDPHEMGAEWCLQCDRGVTIGDVEVEL